MSDAQGRTIKVPIKSNFKEGLSLAEYFISCYGARKGLVDTALRTADSGYLTRRLVDVAQDVIITEEDCGTTETVDIFSLKEGSEVVIHFSELVRGRVAAESFKSDDVTINVGDIILDEHVKAIRSSDKKSFKIRNIFTCKTKRGICRKCYGVDLSTAKLVNLGEAIGIIAAQSIGEPGTQLTMRTFHTGGVDLRKAAMNNVVTPYEGVIEFPKSLSTATFKADKKAMLVVTEDASFSISTSQGIESVFIPKDSVMQVKDKQIIQSNDVIALYDSSSTHVLSESEGVAPIYTSPAGDIIEIAIYDPKNKQTIEGSTEKAKLFNSFDRIGLSSDLGLTTQLETPGIFIEATEKTKSKSTISYYPCQVYLTNSRSDLYVKSKDKVAVNDVLYKEYVSDLDASKTKDIVQGLPRVEELFEARKPKNSAILSDFDGIVEFGLKDNYYLLTILSDTGQKKEYKLTLKTRFLVYSGQTVAKGQQLTDGIIYPQDLLVTKGIVQTQLYLINEIQNVYFSQGVFINNKHLEVIVRQMTRKVFIEDGGDSDFLPNELIDKKVFNGKNEELISNKKEPIVGNDVLLGITRASLNTDSFISAASFQETARVLTDAAIRGKKDEMYGVKENVIIGKQIPAGTGMNSIKSFVLKSESGEITRLTEEDQLFDKVDHFSE